MYSIQEQRAALATARILTGALMSEIRTHNPMDVAYRVPMVFALVRSASGTKGYSGTYWTPVGTILELAAP
jgi:hypothetical protein